MLPRQVGQRLCSHAACQRAAQPEAVRGAIWLQGLPARRRPDVGRGVARAPRRHGSSDTSHDGAAAAARAAAPGGSALAAAGCRATAAAGTLDAGHFTDCCCCILPRPGAGRTSGQWRAAASAHGCPNRLGIATLGGSLQAMLAGLSLCSGCITRAADMRCAVLVRRRRRSRGTARSCSRPGSTQPHSCSSLSRPTVPGALGYMCAASGPPACASLVCRRLAGCGAVAVIVPPVLPTAVQRR